MAIRPPGRPGMVPNPPMQGRGNRRAKRFPTRCRHREAPAKVLICNRYVLSERGSLSAKCAAASRATGTRKGEQET